MSKRIQEAVEPELGSKTGDVEVDKKFYLAVKIKEMSYFWSDIFFIVSHHTQKSYQELDAMDCVEFFRLYNSIETKIIKK